MKITLKADKHIKQTKKTCFEKTNIFNLLLNDINKNSQ